MSTIFLCRLCDYTKTLEYRMVRRQKLEGQEEVSWLPGLLTQRRPGGPPGPLAPPLRPPCGHPGGTLAAPRPDDSEPLPIAFVWDLMAVTNRCPPWLSGEVLAPGGCAWAGWGCWARSGPPRTRRCGVNTNLKFTGLTQNLGRL